MALGTTLSSALDVSTTAGVQFVSLNSAGIALADAALGSGSITVCLMSYYHDYSNNAPTQDGDHTQMRVWYTEAGGSYRPNLSVVHGTGPGDTTTVYAEGSGNDDDAQHTNFTFDGSVSWDTIRGDSTTTGTGVGAETLHTYTGIYTRKFTARGAAVITDNRRSYFVFDLSGITGTVTAVKFNVYIDNVGHTNDQFGKVILVQSTALSGTTADYGNCFVADAAAVTDNATFFGANF